MIHGSGRVAGTMTSRNSGSGLESRLEGTLEVTEPRAEAEAIRLDRLRETSPVWDGLVGSIVA